MSGRISRNIETRFWRLVPLRSSGFVSLCGELTNLDGITPPRRFELLPSTAATNHSQTAAAGNPFELGIVRRANFGGDVKVGLNSALTLTATVNPDVGQVEADPAVVNLSAFESFFAERRPFFTEGLDLFRFRLGDGDGDGSEEELFHTRRIGRAPQGEADPRGGFAERIDRTTILSAAKVSGKTRTGWSLGRLGALTDREDARVLSGTGQSFRDVVFGTSVARSLPDNLACWSPNSHQPGTASGPTTTTPNAIRPEPRSAVSTAGLTPAAPAARFAGTSMSRPALRSTTWASCGRPITSARASGSTAAGSNPGKCSGALTST